MLKLANIFLFFVGFKLIKQCQVVLTGVRTPRHGPTFFYKTIGIGSSYKEAHKMSIDAFMLACCNDVHYSMETIVDTYHTTIRRR